MITRRKFLLVAGWVAAPIAIGGLGWRDTFAWAFDRAAAHGLALVQSPEQRLRAHFSYLNLDPAGVERYFDDFQFYRKLSRHVPLSSEVYTRYLMSTDFFRHGADESRLVRYVGFYDPDNTPCHNPFAEFDDEA